MPALASGGILFVTFSSWAETIPALRIAEAPHLEVADLTGVPGRAIPFALTVHDAPADNSGFLMIRGVPEVLKLSAGFQAGDSWMVALKDARGLELLPPQNFRGRFTMEVILVLRGIGKRDSQIVGVTIAPPEATPKAPSGDLRPTNSIATARIPEEQRPEPRAQPQPAADPELERVLLGRGDQLLQKGDISAARLIYERLANSGSAQGALYLARTHDPDVLSTLGVVGVRGNSAEARRWYEKASELGSATATHRLRELAGR